MLRKQMTDVHCKNYTEYTNTGRAQNADILLLKVVVRVLTTRFQKLNTSAAQQDA
jgi:hypothetical protein